MTDKAYILFSLEDFLTDDFFITSARNPSPESIAFWNGYITSNPPNITEYYAAKRYVLSSNGIQPLIGDEEMSELWTRISAQTGLTRRTISRKRRILAYSSVAAAACAAAVVLFVWIFPGNMRQSHIYEYASMDVDMDGSTETRLVLSDKNTVLLTEHNAQITYDESTIKASEKEIPKEESASYNQLIIPKGRMSKLTLADGTIVWANANTRVVYPVEFADKKREIYVDGEVFLDVAHEKRPFVVKTRQMDVEVLGTRFNVCSFDNKDLQRVVLFEGSVKVSSDNMKSKSVLKPNQMYEAAAGKSRIEEVDVRRYASWINGLYFFEREPLNIVAEKLSEYYAVQILCGEKAGAFLCSGKLDLKDNIRDVIHGLCRTMSLTWEQVEDDTYVITLKNK